ncbi:hypothetical protein BJ912DRAFT_1103603 [Pholiota molesta]|nr:hypothetical protein BJ912DRAFT_1103603 [Pholiota molesta]
MSVQPTLDNTWGAALIGLVVASILYGMTTLQAYIYYTKYPNDVRTIKLLVLTVWILDTVSLCLVISAMYTYLVSDMFSPFRLLVVNRNLNVDPAIMVSRLTLIDQQY